MGTVFDAGDISMDADLPIAGNKPDLNVVVVPDDFEIEEVRGLSMSEMARSLKALKDANASLETQVGRATEAATNAARAAEAAANRPVAPAAQPREIDPSTYRITSEDLLDTTGEALNKKLDALFAVKTSPFISENLQILSEQALGVVKNDKRLEHWDKYENEILGFAARMDVSKTSRLSTWYALYKHVIDQHADELGTDDIEARVQARLKELGVDPATVQPGNRPLPTERGAPRTTTPAGKLSQEQADAARRMGVDPAEAEQYA